MAEPAVSKCSITKRKQELGWERSNVTDSELKDHFKVYKQAEDLILLIFLSSVQNPEDSRRIAQLVEEDIFKILNQDPNKNYRLLVDLSLSGGVPHLSSEAQKVYSNLAKLRQLNKISVVGKNTLLEAAVNLMIQTSGKQHSFKWFNNLEDAKKWLRE